MAIEINKLIKNYIAPDGTSAPVIDIPHLSLADGEQVALIGTSGSGKTTLLHLIAGILAPDSGDVVYTVAESAVPTPPRGFWKRNWPFIVTLGLPLPFYLLLRANERKYPSPTGSVAAGAEVGGVPETTEADRDVFRDRYLGYYSGPKGSGSADTRISRLSQMTEADRDIFRGRYIGYIFQTHHLLAGFTALENVLLGMSFTGRPHDPAWAKHLLTEVGLADRLHYRPQKLSVGQQQRVAVARALANRPRLVLADEPTGALDAKNAQQVLDLIRKLCTEINATLLLVTHDLAIAKQLSRALTLSDINLAAQAVAAVA